MRWFTGHSLPGRMKSEIKERNLWLLDEESLDRMRGEDEGGGAGGPEMKSEALTFD